jgi:hypothetical protein
VPSRMVTPSYMTALRYSALEWSLGISGVDIFAGIGVGYWYVRGLCLFVMLVCGWGCGEVSAWVKGCDVIVA